MSDNIYVLPVAGDKCGGYIRCLRILHSTVWKRTRQYEHIVSLPGVWIDNLLSCFDELLDAVFEFPLGISELIRTSKDSASRADVCTCKVATGESKEVRWDRDWLVESVKLRVRLAVLAGLGVFGTGR